MNVQRALKIIPREAVISAECKPNFYGGAWVIWARMDGYERPVTQFTEPFSAARWVHTYYRALEV